jgi:hypothetical protein
MRCLAVLIVALALAAFGPGRAMAADVLITQAEANLPSPGDTMMATRGLTRGPGVEQLTPDPDSKGVKSPLPLKIKFVGRNNVAIDPASVKVTYLRTPSIDLTERIKAHLTPDGIDMKEVEVPPGTHVLRLDVRDQQGRASTATIKLTVAPK